MHKDDHETASAAPIRSLISRRLLLQGVGAAALLPALPAIGSCATTVAPAAAPTAGNAFDFTSLKSEVIPTLQVPDGYDSNVLVRWGDAMFGGAKPFAATTMDAADQEKRFGFNCDYVGYFPLPRGSNSSDHGLLFVNHEYAATAEMMPPDAAVPPPSAAQTALEQSAVGASVVEIKREDGVWKFVENSTYSRRFTARTPFEMKGPAAGYERLRTSADPTGARVLGTLGNCAGGRTPWGTALSAEENFQNYFVGTVPENHRETDALIVAQAGVSPAEQLALSRGTPSTRSTWGQFETRFDVSKEPTESNRFGWMVEVDPYDPASTPVKRTALGRFRHEAASVVVNHDGRVVVYLGEDRPWGFVFRFVSRGKFDAAKGVENGKLLDDGTLFVAQFQETTLSWLPLIYGKGKLTRENGITCQADVFVDARRAAQLAGGTPMDRPEDIDTSPLSGHVFVNLTRNNDRKDVHIDAANPRAENEDGHTLELVPPKGKRGVDHTAIRYEWSVLLLAGPVDQGGVYGSPDAAAFSGPDNLAFDPKGRLWIATDNRRWSWPKPIPNGVFACAVEGPQRAVTRFFLNVPAGAEACGPEFTPDGTTFFLAVQHPSEDLKPKPAKSWPDFTEGVPARPSVVAVTRKGGGMIGG